MTYPLFESFPGCREADIAPGGDERKPGHKEAAPRKSVDAASVWPSDRRRRDPIDVRMKFGEGQRERAVLTRGRGREDRLSRSAARSITISVPSAMTRVPSGSIDPSLMPRRMP